MSLTASLSMSGTSVSLTFLFKRAAWSPIQTALGHSPARLRHLRHMPSDKIADGTWGKDYTVEY